MSLEADKGDVDDWKAIHQDPDDDATHPKYAVTDWLHDTPRYVEGLTTMAADQWEEGTPWEEKLYTILGGSREYLAGMKSFKELASAGWKDRLRQPRNPCISDYTYYSPEGERKRCLPLPLACGSEYFEERPALFDFIRERMEAYITAKENEQKEKEEKGDEQATPLSPSLYTEVPETGSSCVVLAGAPRLDRSSNKLIWPARLMTSEEAEEFEKDHSVKLDETVAGVVLLCWGSHHTSTTIKKEHLRRISVAELEYLIKLWMEGGNIEAEDMVICRPLKDAQLGIEFLAGLGYAAAFAKLGNTVSMEKPIRNDESVTGFTEGQLEDPWQHVVPPDFVKHYPELKACDKCAASHSRCEGPEWLARSLHHIEKQGHVFPRDRVAMIKSEVVSKRKFFAVPDSGQSDSSTTTTTTKRPRAAAPSPSRVIPPRSLPPSSASAPSSPSRPTGLPPSSAAASAANGRRITRADHDSPMKRRVSSSGNLSALASTAAASDRGKGGGRDRDSVGGGGSDYSSGGGGTSSERMMLRRGERRAGGLVCAEGLPSTTASTATAGGGGGGGGGKAPPPPAKRDIAEVGGGGGKKGAAAAGGGGERGGEVSPHITNLAQAFIRSWRSLLLRVSFTSPEPISVKCIEQIVLPQLLEKGREEANGNGVISELGLAHDMFREAIEKVHSYVGYRNAVRQADLDRLMKNFKEILEVSSLAEGVKKQEEEGVGSSIEGREREWLNLLIKRCAAAIAASQAAGGGGVGGSGSNGLGNGGGGAAAAAAAGGEAGAQKPSNDVEKRIRKEWDKVKELEKDVDKLKKVLRTLSESSQASIKPAILQQEEELKQAKARFNTLNDSRKDHRALEKLRPLVPKIDNLRSKVEASCQQLEDALHLVEMRWQAFRQAFYQEVGQQTTLLIYDIRCASHRVPEAHVEQPKRFLDTADAMRGLARDYPRQFELMQEIGDEYFPLWRGEPEGYITEVLRVHTESHLDHIRIRCEEAGSDITRLSIPRRAGGREIRALRPSSSPPRRAPASALALTAASSASTIAAASSTAPLPPITGPSSSSAAAAVAPPLPPDLSTTTTSSTAMSATTSHSTSEHKEKKVSNPAIEKESKIKAYHGEGGAGNVIEGDTFGNKDSFIATSVGFAASLQAVDRVMEGKAKNAFVACRPPGHHAGRDGKPAVCLDANELAKEAGWGFCFLNYVAGAALHAIERWDLKRVTCIDFDLHSGNGTEEILTKHCSKAFQFISIHASGIFPYTGDKSRYPTLVNIPIEGVLTPSKYRRVWSKIDEAVDVFKPDFIVVSCGYDAHRNGPLNFRGATSRSGTPAGRLSSEDYYDLVERLINLADRHCLGRLVGVMEGGYCCRPPSEALDALGVGGGGTGSSGTDAMMVDEDYDSDQDLTIPSNVDKETIRHCITATCRAMAKLPRVG